MITRVARIAGRVALGLAVLYGVLVGLGLLFTRVLDGSSILTEEDQFSQALADNRTPTMNDVTWVLSGLGNTGAIIAALLVVSGSLYLAMRRWGPPLFLITAVSAQAMVFLLVTLTIDRERPQVKKLDAAPPTSSFPSGHTGASVALFLGSALLVALYVRRRWVRIVGLTVLVAVPLLVAYARMYRGMHHPTDVIGSFVNGITCVAVSARQILGRGLRGERRPDPRPAPVTATGASRAG